MERVRVVMLDNHDWLSKGEEFNLPHELASSLVSSGKAQKVGVHAEPAPTETKPAGPSETKVVVPAQRKGKAK